MEDSVRSAIEHHVTTNRHHPDFHADPNDMSDVDLIEMVCDWTAMAQEFEQDGGSARGWRTRQSAADYISVTIESDSSIR